MKTISNDLRTNTEMPVQAPNRSMRERWEEAHELPRFRPAYPHEQAVRWTFRNLERNSTPKQKVLDLGCGAGRHSLFLAAEGFDVYATDLSATGIRELQATARNRGLEVKAHQAAAHDLSRYEDGFFDAVMSFAVMCYMTLHEVERMLAEVQRVLRPGGKFLCVTRTDADGRRQHASPVSDCAWRIHALDSNAPSDIEKGMDMLFFSRQEVERLFAGFTDVTIDRMSYIHGGFADDDWVVSASKP